VGVAILDVDFPTRRGYKRIVTRHYQELLANKEIDCIVAAVRRRCDGRSRAENGVFGHNVALACQMANESYFRKSAVRWGASLQTIKS
jgi:hypothetical protein